MKSLKTLLVAALVGLTFAALSAPASARGYYGRGGYHGHPHAHFSYRGWGPYWGYWGPRYWGGAFWGPGYWGGGYWGSAYYAAPPVVVVPQEPRVYVERDAAPASTPVPSTQPSAPAQQWWYWCASANGYYPYVSTCAEGWQRVAPQPSQAPR